MKKFLIKLHEQAEQRKRLLKHLTEQNKNKQPYQYDEELVQLEKEFNVLKVLHSDEKPFQKNNLGERTFKEALEVMGRKGLLELSQKVWKVKRIKTIVPLLSKAIEIIDLNKSEYKTRILDSPWVRLPNVAQFNIQIKGVDLLFKLFGIKKNIPPVVMLSKYKSKAMNRYLEHQIRRLIGCRESNPKLYWSMAKILMKRSNVFRVSAVNHVIPNWHRNFPLHYIVNCNRKLSKLINGAMSEMDFSRVYIPKGEKGWRPLGVPTIEWRLYLHMYSNFLTLYLQPKLHKNQHGFFPNKGTLTAWKQIFTDELYKYPWIQEWDFKGYFDSIHSNRITEELLRMKVPKDVAYFLENINRSNPKLPEEKLLDESKVEKQIESQTSIKKGDPYEGLFSTYKEMIKDTTPYIPDEGEINPPKTVGEANFKLLAQFMFEDGFDNMFEYIQAQWAVQDHYRPAKIEQDFNGVAQGAPTSPILANVIMDIWMRQMNRNKDVVTVAYADDSITFSKVPLKMTDTQNQAPEDTGIVIHPDKSQMVKRNGIWKGAIKFLGLKFDGLVLQANTRKGSKLMFEQKIKDLLKLEETRLTQGLKIESRDDIIKYLDKDESTSSTSAGSSWREYFKSKLIGFVQSRLYQGDWNLENLEQDFNYRFVNQSWAEKIGPKKGDLNVFNSSSFACYSLYNIFRWNQFPRKRFNRKPKANLFTEKGQPVWNTRKVQKIEKKILIRLGDDTLVKSHGTLHPREMMDQELSNLMLKALDLEYKLWFGSSDMLMK